MEDKDHRLIELGEQIKKLRKKRDLTQADLASRVNKDQQSIQRLEAGRVNPSYIYLCEISYGLDIGIVEMLSMKES